MSEEAPKEPAKVEDPKAKTRLVGIARRAKKRKARAEAAKKK